MTDTAEHHDHGHHHGHDHAAQDKKAPPTPAPDFKARASALLKDDKARTLGLTAALLGTTALAAPVLTSTFGAAVACGAALYLLAKSSGLLLDHVEGLGKKAGIPQFWLGLGIGAAASVPELIVAVKSAMTGAYEIGIGNLVGANIAHVFLILGATAAIAGIQANKGVSWKYNMYAMAGATLGFAGLLATNSLNLWTGGAMALLGAAYLGGNAFFLRKDAKELNVPAENLVHNHNHGNCDHDSHKEAAPLWQTGLWIAAGLGALIFSADTIVDTASTVARNTGVSQAMIGALGVAFGTSLPELTVSVAAAKRGNTDMAVGNVLSCNIFNILFVGGAMALAGASVPPSFSPATTLGMFNLAALGASAALMTTALTVGQGSIKKWQGYAAIGVYAAYVAATAALGGYQHVEEKAPTHHALQHKQDQKSTSPRPVLLARPS